MYIRSKQIQTRHKMLYVGQHDESSSLWIHVRKHTHSIKKRFRCERNWRNESSDKCAVNVNSKTASQIDHSLKSYNAAFENRSINKKNIRLEEEHFRLLSKNVFLKKRIALVLLRWFSDRTFVFRMQWTLINWKAIFAARTARELKWTPNVYYWINKYIIAIMLRSSGYFRNWPSQLFLSGANGCAQTSVECNWEDEWQGKFVTVYLNRM